MPDAALLVIDLQRDFLESGGRMPIAPSQVEPLLTAANGLIDAAVTHAIPVIYVVNAFPRSQRLQNFFRRGAGIAGTMGAEIDPRVHVVAGATFAKEQGDAFSNPALDAFLRAKSIVRLTLIGVFAPACVRATTRGAIRKGYRVTVVSDGVGARSDGARDRALSRIARDGATVAARVEAERALTRS